MVQYNFKPEHAPGVTKGTKLLTMREPRQPGSRHARLGDALQLTTLGRTKKRRVLTTADGRPATCTLRATVVLGPNGVVRVTDAQAGTDSIKAQGIAMLLAQAEQGSAEADRWANALAVLDGFPDYPALYAWHAANGARFKPDANGYVSRELIGWMQ